MLRVRSAGGWSAWLDLGVWSADEGRHSSCKASEDPDWNVETDTVVSRSGATADAYQYRLELRADGGSRLPVVRSVSVVVSRPGEGFCLAPLRSAWGRDLRVPETSQMVFDRGEEWCSPVSLSMTMAYWAAQTGNRGLARSVPEVARGVYDRAYNGWGNWPFNTAYASRFGLEGAVGRLGCVEEAERWLDAGVPLVASVAWDNSRDAHRLSGAPIPRSDGHLLVVRGFTGSGDVISNDPAAPDEAGVRRVYRRGEFARAWLTNPGSSGGVVYLVHPPGWDTPEG